MQPDFLGMGRQTGGVGGGGELLVISWQHFVLTKVSHQGLLQQPEFVCALLEIKLPHTGKSMQASGHCRD